MKPMLCCSALLVAVWLPVVAHGQLPPLTEADSSGRGAAAVTALASMRGQFIGSGSGTAFRPASPVDAAILASATALPDEQLLPLIDCLADTSRSLIPYGERSVSRGYVCYFAAIQTSWFRRNRPDIPPTRLIYALVSSFKIDAEQQQRASAIWREYWISSQRRTSEPP